MPRRTNDFQRLVYLVQVNLAEGATVTESKMLVDRSTGTEREVDVCIEGKIGTHPVMVCVECRDHARIADVGWVDQMKGKHARLPTNALILASKKGFTPEARNAAEAHGIATISLSEVEDFDFPALLGFGGPLWAKTFSFSAEKVLFRVTAPGIDESVAVSPDNTIFSEEGETLGSAMDVVRPLVNSPRAIDHFAKHGAADHVWFEIEWESPTHNGGKPMFLEKTEYRKLCQVQAISVKGPCKIDINRFELKGAKLGEVMVAWGKTNLAGQDALVVVTKDDAGKGKLSINVKAMPSSGS